MKGINKQILLGRIGKLEGGKIQLKTVGDNKHVAEFSVATNDYNDSVEWHNVQCWGRDAEYAAKYLQQGSLVYIEGRTKTKTWTDNDGNKKYRTIVIAAPGGVQGVSRPSKSSGDDEAGF